MSAWRLHSGKEIFLSLYSVFNPHNLRYYLKCLNFPHFANKKKDQLLFNAENINPARIFSFTVSWGYSFDILGRLKSFNIVGHNLLNKNAIVQRILFGVQDYKKCFEYEYTYHIICSLTPAVHINFSFSFLKREHISSIYEGAPPTEENSLSIQLMICALTCNVLDPTWLSDVNQHCQL